MNQVNNQFSRRQLLKLMGGTAGMVALAACAPVNAPTGGEGAAEAPASATGQLSVVHRREYFKSMEDLFAEAVSNWGGENDVELEVSTVAAEAFEDFVAKLLAQVEAGDPPDLVYHRSGLVQLMVFQDALEPVTDTVEEAIGLYGAPAATLEAAMFIDDEWYGVPYILAGGGTFARRSLLEEAGIDPMSITTLDDLRDAALAASNPEEEIYGWGMTVNQSGDGAGLIADTINSYGGTVTNADATELTFNSPETIAAVTWLAEIYNRDGEYGAMLPPGVEAWTDSSNNEAYLAGNIAITRNAGSVYAKALEDGNPVFEDTVVIPTQVGPAGVKLEGANGAQFNVPRNAANTAQAKELALYLLTPDVFLPISLISAGLFLPAYEGVYDNPQVVEAFEADPNLATMGRQGLGDYTGISYPAEPSPFFDAITAQSVLTDMMAQINSQGASVEDAVAQAEDRMRSIAEEVGLELQ